MSPQSHCVDFCFRLPDIQKFRLGVRWQSVFVSLSVRSNGWAHSETHVRNHKTKPLPSCVHPFATRQVMRATAFIQRAYSHGRALSDLLQKVVVDMPTQTTLDVLHEVRWTKGAAGERKAAVERMYSQESGTLPLLPCRVFFVGVGCTERGKQRAKAKKQR